MYCGQFSVLRVNNGVLEIFIRKRTKEKDWTESAVAWKRLPVTQRRFFPVFPLFSGRFRVACINWCLVYKSSLFIVTCDTSDVDLGDGLQSWRWMAERYLSFCNQSLQTNCFCQILIYSVSIRAQEYRSCSKVFNANFVQCWHDLQHWWIGGGEGGRGGGAKTTLICTALQRAVQRAFQKILPKEQVQRTMRLLWQDVSSIPLVVLILGSWKHDFFVFKFQSTFAYNSRLWSNKTVYNSDGGTTGFDRNETMLPSYWRTPFSRICLGMMVKGHIRFVVINKKASSLHSLIADGQYRPTSLGRNKWKTLIGSDASLQRNCNKEGFNAVPTSLWAMVRIGFLANNEYHCKSCDSVIGFGIIGGNSCGNFAQYSPDNGNRATLAMGSVLVQWVLSRTGIKVNYILAKMP